MNFRSYLLLDKHKEKFCIGGEFIKTQEPETPLDMVSITAREQINSVS